MLSLVGALILIKLFTPEIAPAVKLINDGVSIVEPPFETLIPVKVLVFKDSQNVEEDGFAT